MVKTFRNKESCIRLKNLRVFYKMETVKYPFTSITYRLKFWSVLVLTQAMACGAQEEISQRTLSSLWRRRWHPTPVLLPGKSHGQRSLVGCSPWGREEWNTTEPTSLSLFTFMHCRRKWQPTPVFLPGESQGRGSLVGCDLWGRTESDTTKAT